MKITLTLFVALIAISTAVVLNPAVHVARIGTQDYNNIAGGDSCPKKIAHGKSEAVVKGSSDFQGFGIEYKMLFGDITVDGEACEGKNNKTEAYMAVLSNAELRRYFQANPLQLSPDASVKVVVAGFDTDVRVCGDYESSTGDMFYLYTMEIDAFQPALESKGVMIDEKFKLSGDQWMITFQGVGADNPCVYINSEARALKALETPEPGAEELPPVTEEEPAKAPALNPAEDNPALAEMTPQASPEQDTGGNICFPASATVELADGTVKTMDRVELGDRVKVADGSFSTVFMFTHKMANVKHSFVNVKTSSGSELALTAGHFIYVNGNLVPASTIKAGDFVESASGERLTVQAVSQKILSGLYNPQTEQGDIVVNGVRASTYTTTAIPAAAHALLAPLRGVYSGFGLTTSFLDAGMDSLRQGVRSILA